MAAGCQDTPQRRSIDETGQRQQDREVETNNDD
jgi:hypothetical protein